MRRLTLVSGRFFTGATDFFFVFLSALRTLPSSLLLLVLLVGSRVVDTGSKLESLGNGTSPSFTVNEEKHTRYFTPEPWVAMLENETHFDLLFDLPEFVFFVVFNLGTTNG